MTDTPSEQRGYYEQSGMPPRAEACTARIQENSRFVTLPMFLVLRRRANIPRARTNQLIALVLLNGVPDPSHRAP
jgi:hypothetical protein